MLLATDADFLGALLAEARELFSTFWYLWTLLALVWLAKWTLRVRSALRCGAPGSRRST